MQCSGQSLWDFIIWLNPKLIQDSTSMFNLDIFYYLKLSQDFIIQMHFFEKQ